MAPAGPPLTQATLDALNLAIASGVRSVRFQDRTVEYASIDDMIKAANYIYGLLYPGGGIGIGPGGVVTGGQTRQIRCYTNKGL
jgi:hypothetical protein